jgi:hypothetical protein
MRQDENRGKQEIAGPHVEAGQAKFGENPRGPEKGLRGHDERHESLVDQDTPGKHDIDQAPAGLRRERKGPLNTSSGRRTAQERDQ